MKLLNDVSRNELLHMRESGMNNQEIANALDVSYQTVLRIIGKQPSDLRRQPPRNPHPVIIEAPASNVVSVAEEQETCLAILDRSISLIGDVAEYKVDCADNILTMTIGDNSICVSLPQISALLKELNAIERHITDVKIENEMW